MSKKQLAPNKPTRPTLASFMQAKLRAGCLVCQLPTEIRAQLGRVAVKRGFSRQDQVEWLRVACSATKVTLDILNTHLNSHHDREEDFNGTA